MGNVLEVLIAFHIVHSGVVLTSERIKIGILKVTCFSFKTETTI
jgi:hypothetical protein